MGDTALLSAWCTFADGGEHGPPSAASRDSIRTYVTRIASRFVNVNRFVTMIPDTRWLALQSCGEPDGEQYRLLENAMKFSLSHCFLVIALIALACGWYADRSRLLAANQRLNAECAELFTAQQPGPLVVDSTAPPRRGWIPFTGSTRLFMLYDATDPEDRENYRAGRLPKR